MSLVFNVLGGVRGGSLAHGFDGFITNAIIADARAFGIAVTVGAAGGQQPVARGQLGVEVYLRRLVRWVKNLDAV